MVIARPERFAEALLPVISTLLQREIRDPRVGFVTLTGARVSPDLRQARVLITVMGSEEARQKALEALNGAAGYLQRAVFKQMHLRRSLQLTFVLDEAVAKGTRIEELLDQIKNREGGEEG